MLFLPCHADPGTDSCKDKEFLKYSEGIYHVELILAFGTPVHFRLGPHTPVNQG